MGFIACGKEWYRFQQNLMVSEIVFKAFQNVRNSFRVVIIMDDQSAAKLQSQKFTT